MTDGKYAISDVLVDRSALKNKQNYVSWSKQGHIAYVLDPENDDGFNSTEGNLRLTYMECVDGLTWQLAPPTFLNISSILHHSRFEASAHYNTVAYTKPFPSTAYVLFSNTGWDLFTADCTGAVTILVTGIKKVTDHKPNRHLAALEEINENIKQVQFSRSSFNTCEAFYSDYQTTYQHVPGNAILTAKWLNLDKMVIANNPAIRIKQDATNQVLNGCASKMGAASDDTHGYYYRYNISQHKSYGPCHPLPTKQACIAVRQNGEVCLFHQEDHGIDYVKAVGKLSDEDDEHISKCSIGFHSDGTIVIVAYYGISQKLRFYEIQINWSYLKIAAKMLVENPSYKVPVEEKTPVSFSVKKFMEKDVSSLIDGYKLINVDAISPTYEENSNLEILITLENRRLNVTDPVKTLVLRYFLEHVPMIKQIRQSFKDIASKNGIDVLSLTDTSCTLKYIQKLEINDAVISMETLHLDMYIGLTLSTGVIKLFNRTNFEEIHNKFSASYKNNDPEVSLPESVSTLLDAGYEFPSMSIQPVYCHISPNLCAYVNLPIDKNILQLKCAVTQNVDDQYLKRTKKGLMLTKAAVLALRHTTACYFGYFTDDLVATIRNDLAVLSKIINESYAYRLRISILQEAHRAINLNIDIPHKQSDKMTQSQPLQKLLMLQLSLGTLKNWKQTRSGKVALALVNLRYISSSVLYTLHTIYSNMQRFARKGYPALDTLVNAKMREECIVSVIGPMRWCMDYIVLLSQELMELDSAFKSKNAEQIEKLIKNSIVAPLILGKIPRSFLVSSIANIKRLFTFFQKFIEKMDPSIAAKITAENQLGAFDVVEDTLMNEDDSVIQTKFAGDISNDKMMGVNTKAVKAIITQPTIEAYFRIGEMIKRLPVSLSIFEKFLTDADAPLRNIKLDAPMSLAVEQQIVCQGHVSKNFVDTIRKLCDVFSKSVLGYPGTRASDLYFYDVSWLGFDSLGDDNDDNDDDDDGENNNNNDLGFGDNTESSKDAATTIDVVDVDGDILLGDANDEGIKKPGEAILSFTDIKRTRNEYRRLLKRSIRYGGVIDYLRKEWVSPDDIMKCIGECDLKNGSSTTTTISSHTKTAYMPPMASINERKPILRKCIRCGFISLVHDEVMFVPNSMTFVANPVFQHYQRVCICGGSWANL